MLETAPKRVRAGFSLAIVTLVAIFGSMLLCGVDCLRHHILIILSGCSGVGLVLLLYQRRRASASDVSPNIIQDQAALANEHPLAFLSNSGYWGWIVINSTIVLYVFCQFQMPPKEVVVSQPRPKKVMARELAQPPRPAPVMLTNFPDLKLTGLVCNGSNSTAVINGVTIGIGESVENVTLIAVEDWRVIVELNGVKKPIPYGD